MPSGGEHSRQAPLLDAAPAAWWLLNANPAATDNRQALAEGFTPKPAWRQVPWRMVAVMLLCLGVQIAWDGLSTRLRMR